MFLCISHLKHPHDPRCIKQDISLTFSTLFPPHLLLCSPHPEPAAVLHSSTQSSDRPCHADPPHLSAPLPVCFPAPQQEAAAEHGPQNGAQSRGSVASPDTSPEAPGAGEEVAAKPVHQHDPTSSRISTTIGGGVCNTNSFVPTYSKENLSLFTVPKVTFDHSPRAKKPFLACFLPRALAALHLLLAFIQSFSLHTSSTSIFQSLCCSATNHSLPS